jgi:hypothetical protein
MVVVAVREKDEVGLYVGNGVVTDGVISEERIDNQSDTIVSLYSERGVSVERKFCQIWCPAGR